MTENPYASPASCERSAENGPPDSSFSQIARKTFLAWEKMRVIYIAVLGVVTIGMIVGMEIPVTVPLAVVVAANAVGANCLYFAGPAVDTYVSWLGYQEPWPRWLLFGAGTILAVLLAVEFLVHPLGPWAPRPTRAAGQYLPTAVWAERQPSTVSGAARLARMKTACRFAVSKPTGREVDGRFVRELPSPQPSPSGRGRRAF